jgi:hypothetical protein
MFFRKTRERNVGEMLKKTEDGNVKKMDRTHVGNGVLFHHPYTPPPGGGIVPPKSRQGLAIIKNVQKTLKKKRRKNAGTREAQVLKRRPGGLQEISARQLLSLGQPEKEHARKTHKMRRKHGRGKSNKNEDKHIEKTSA